MKGKEFIDFAGICAARAEGEAMVRSGVSRAYYGALHEALDLLESWECSPGRSASAHSDTAIYLQNSGCPHLQFAGGLLDHLRRLCVDSDYRLDRPTTVATAKNAVEKALRICEELGKSEPQMQEAVIRAIKSQAALMQRPLSGKKHP